MKNIWIAAMFLAATPAASAAVVVVGAPENLTVVEHATSDATAAVGKAKDNRGDILTFANPVFDAADKTQVGSDNGFCIRTVAGAAYECIWTLKLADGQITSEGPFHDKGDTMMAVTGGTGKYIGAKGQMLLHARDAKGSEYDFKYTLVK
ncbi:MAG TPA: allene oxide cyclase family protein [Rhizomicrobium sp.]|nr:allene oxide cyclase family protein [Rhizomicrobium sp.]